MFNSFVKLPEGTFEATIIQNYPTIDAKIPHDFTTCLAGNTKKPMLDPTPQKYRNVQRAIIWRIREHIDWGIDFDQPFTTVAWGLQPTWIQINLLGE